MSPARTVLSFAALAVVMVTAAPLTNQESLVQAEGIAANGNRAKRADEEIYFGNQQNKVRAIAKKSFPLAPLSQLEAEVSNGEPDVGGKVTVHKEVPVDADVADRAEAALAPSEDARKTEEAMEAAMHSLDESQESNENTEQERDGEDQEEAEEVAHLPPLPEDGDDDEGDGDNDSTSEIVETGEDSPVEGEDQEEEQGSDIDGADDETTGEVDDGGEEAAAAEEGEKEDANDEEENELEQAAANSETEGSENESKAPIDPELLASRDEVSEFLQRLQSQNEPNDMDVGLEGDDPTKDMKDYYRMYQYMLGQAPYGGAGRMLNPGYFRRRRSSRSGHHGRRIKRDLLDDGTYSPYDLYNMPYPPIEITDDAIPNSDDYVPLTDEEAEYLYNRLLTYLTENYAEGVEKNEDDDESEEENMSLADLKALSRYADAEDAGYPFPQYVSPTFSESEEPEYVPEFYDRREPYIGEADDEEGVIPYGPGELEASRYNPYEKRDMIDYYKDDRRKRYFFPFSDEPETHWAAFVPEKRDYGEMVQRLQRLAMALSDNPAPYYSEMLEEYKKK